MAGGRQQGREGKLGPPDRGGALPKFRSDRPVRMHQCRSQWHRRLDEGHGGSVIDDDARRQQVECRRAALLRESDEQ